MEPYKVVFDSNVWARFIRSDNIYPLAERIKMYHILPVLDNYLLSEIHLVILKNEWTNEKSADRLIQLINGLSYNVSQTIRTTYRLSPRSQR